MHLESRAHRRRESASRCFSKWYVLEAVEYIRTLTLPNSTPGRRLSARVVHPYRWLGTRGPARVLRYSTTARLKLCFKNLSALRRQSWSRSVPAEPDVLRPKSRPESARVNSAARDASSTELMAPACLPTRSPTILMPRARSSVERRPTSVRSAAISRWPSRPRGRAQRRRKHRLGLGVCSTMARHTPE